MPNLSFQIVEGGEEQRRMRKTDFDKKRTGMAPYSLNFLAPFSRSAAVIAEKN